MVDVLKSDSRIAESISLAPAELWRQVLDSLDTAICAVDRDLRVVLVNRVWDGLAHLFERTELRSDRLIGQPFLDILDGDAREQWTGSCARLLDGEEASTWAELAWPARGGWHWMMVTAAALFNADREVIGISFSLMDASEHRHRDEERAKRQVELRGLFEVAQSVSLVTDGVELFRRVTGHLGYLFGARICAIALCDEEMNQLVTHSPAHGLTPADAKAFHVPSVLLGGNGDAQSDSIAPSYLLYNDVPTAGEGGPAFAERWQIGCLLIAPLRHQNRLLGYLILADAHNIFNDEAGRLLATFAGSIAAAIDASQLLLALQDRADKLSAALSEIQELDRLKDEMIQNVSHELRLPLMVIQGYSDLLKTGAFGKLEPKLQEAVEVISNKTDVLGKRVNDISLLRGLRQTDLEWSVTSLATLSREAIERARPHATERGIDLVTDISPDTTSALRVDCQRMAQVVDELLDNAIKFSPNGGEVRVTVREGGDVVYLKVTDHGIGIPTDHINRIWDRFYQSDGSTTRRFGGTGIGLSVVKQIVEAHGGQVWAESVEGRGSQFYVALRQEKAAKAGPAG